MSNKGSYLKELDEKLNESRAKPLSLKAPVVVMDPPEIQELRKELQYHPELVAKLGNSIQDPLYVIIGLLAAEVDIAMDGNYSAADLLRVTELIIDRLRERRGAVIIVRS